MFTLVQSKIGDAFFASSRDNTVKFEEFRFPGGELGVRLDLSTLETYRPVIIKAHMTKAEDPVLLALLVDALRRAKIEKISLVLYYVPYARQDRVANRGESHSIKVFADMINAMGFDNVAIYDPHSFVTEALIDNCSVISKLDLFAAMNLSIDWKNTVVVAPDAGAVKSVFEVASRFGAGGFATASKVRDVATGKIIRTEFTEDVMNKRVLVIDDICDGGRTFVELAKLIRPQEPARLELYVTHGIFSKGYDELAEYFDRIYTTNSFHPNARGNIRPDGVADDRYYFHELNVVTAKKETKSV